MLHNSCIVTNDGNTPGGGGGGGGGGGAGGHPPPPPLYMGHRDDRPFWVGRELLEIPS